MINEIGAVIVTYHPDEKFSLRVASLTKQIDRIIIVDNGSTEQEIQSLMTLMEIHSTKLNFIWNHNNFGIAKALNQGCEQLLSEGYRFALLLDQDSIVEESMVSLLYQTAINYPNVAIVGPRILMNPSDHSDGTIESKFFTWKKFIFFKRSYVKVNQVQSVELNITSGSVIDLSTWKKLGGFWEGLFIQGVDDEYCLRVRANGYQILINGDAKLMQSYGDMKAVRRFGLGFMPTNHSAIRHYYVARNRIKIIRKHKYAFFYVSYQLLSLSKTILTIVLSEDNVREKLLSMIKGTWHGAVNKNI